MDCSLMATQAYGEEDICWEEPQLAQEEPIAMADTLLYEDGGVEEPAEPAEAMVVPEPPKGIEACPDTQVYADTSSPEKLTETETHLHDFPATQAYVDEILPAPGGGEMPPETSDASTNAAEEQPSVATDSAEGPSSRLELACTQAYLDVDELTRDMPDTLWYGQSTAAVTSAAEPDEAAGMHDDLDATQAYGDEPCDAFCDEPSRPSSPPKSPVRGGTSSAMLPPPPPVRTGQQRNVKAAPIAEAPKEEACTPADIVPRGRNVATPARSPAKRRSSTIITVEDEPPEPKRRKLIGKQPPPVPNPWPVCSAPPRGAAPRSRTTGRKDAKKKAPQRKTKAQQVCFATTGLVLDKHVRSSIKKTLGARVVDEWSPKVTHIVASEFRRTTKMMCAVCNGCQIVVPGFLDACLNEGQLVDSSSFVLCDAAGEAAFQEKQSLSSYALQEALEIARGRGSLLQGMPVHWSGGTAAERKEMRVLVEAAGGRWLSRKPRHVEATEPDQLPSTLLLGQDYDPELLREAACTQVFRLSKYALPRT
ncbi:PAXIP1 [Symbiodinium sp. CCMP2592]|nr:PAXIP1 [Symbiodinium sp. CCMP2592]